MKVQKTQAFNTFRAPHPENRIFSSIDTKGPQITNKPTREASIKHQKTTKINNMSQQHSRISENSIRNINANNSKPSSKRQSPLKQKMQTSNVQIISDRYPSIVSLQRTQISLPSPFFPQQQINLLNLQSSLFIQVLKLRQSKINLIQQLNDTFDKKNTVQRQVNKLIKAKNRLTELLIDDHTILESKIKQKDQNLWVPKKNYQVLLQRFVQLRNRLKEQTSMEKDLNQLIQLGSVDHQMLRQCQKYQRLCENIEKTLAKLTNQNNNIETNYNQTVEHLESIVAQLQSRKVQLSSEVNGQVSSQILRLREQNQQLIHQANEIIKKKRRKGEVASIEGLTKIIEIDDRMKQTFVKDIIRYKDQIDRLKGENAHLRLKLKE